MDVASGIFGAGFVLMWIIAGVIGLVAFAFWVWMIIDCAGRTFPKDNEKLVWLLLLVLIGIFTVNQGFFADIVSGSIRRRDFNRVPAVFEGICVPQGKD